MKHPPDPARRAKIGRNLPVLILLALIILAPVTTLVFHWKRLSGFFEAAGSQRHNETVVAKNATVEGSTHLPNVSGENSTSRTSKIQDRLVEDRSAKPWSPPPADVTPAGPSSTSRKVKKATGDRILPEP